MFGPASPAWDDWKEAYQHDGSTSKHSQAHGSPHGWLPLNQTVLLGGNVAKAMQCSF